MFYDGHMTWFSLEPVNAVAYFLSTKFSFFISISYRALSAFGRGLVGALPRPDVTPRGCV